MVSASDSRSEGCPFKSGSVHFLHHFGQLERKFSSLQGIFIFDTDVTISQITKYVFLMKGFVSFEIYFAADEVMIRK